MSGVFSPCDDRFTLWIERDNSDRIPIACMTRPASGVSCSGVDIHRMPSSQNLMVFASMTLCRAHVGDAAVLMIVVVPKSKRSGPEARLLQIGESICRKLRTVLGRAKQGFAEGII